jgi:hypothetical protein
MSILNTVAIYVGDELKNVKLEKYSKEQIVLRFPSGIKLTLDASKVYPQGFPVDAGGNIPQRTVFSTRILWIFKLTIIITAAQWKLLIATAIKGGMLPWPKL